MKTLYLILLFSFSTSLFAQMVPDIAINGHMNRDYVAKEIQQVAPKLDTCVQKLQKKEPKAQGQLSVTYLILTNQTKLKSCTITSDGVLDHKEFNKCARNALCKVNLPAPKLDTEVIVKIPIISAH